MSWLARSVINSLRPDSDSDSDSDPPPPDSDPPPQPPDSDSQPPTPSRGVKEDISELTQTLTRQFWGVASFLAPPPGSDAPGSDSESDSDPVPAPALAGIRSDLAEIGGKVRSGISVLSSKGVTEVSKIASTLFGDDDEDDDEDGEEMVGGVGVSEEVVAFVRSVSLHPETWLDFPVLRGDDAADDFDMSDAQEEHALLIEQLAPSLAALRFQLCPHHMSEGCFWKIYFVLLHPKLTKHDAGLLSTPQIVQARATLLQDLPIRKQPITDLPAIETLDLPLVDKLATIDIADEVVGSPSQSPIFGMPTKEQTPEKTPDSASNTASKPSTEIETDKHQVQATEVQIVEKSVIEEEPIVQVKREDTPSNSMTSPALRYEEDNDEWLEEETGETSVSRGMPIHLGNEEEVSFSDLEADDDDDDDDEGMRLSSKTKTLIGSPTKDESGWIELDKGSEGAPRSGNTSSPDWLDVDIPTV